MHHAAPDSVTTDDLTPALTVYITEPAAPLCRRVCEFLDRRGYTFTTIEVSTDADRAAMRRRTGHATCPLVLADDEVIGRRPHPWPRHLHQPRRHPGPCPLGLAETGSGCASPPT